jgi:hypothetical protein
MAAGNSPSGCPRYAAVNSARATFIATVREWSADPTVASCDLNDEITATFVALQHLINGRQVDVGAAKETAILTDDLTAARRAIATTRNLSR